MASEIVRLYNLKEELSRKHPRRAVLAGFMAMVFARLFPERLVWGQESESVDIRWRVPREKVRTVREQLNFEGEITGDPSTIEDSKGLPLIYILVGVVAIGQLARTLLEIYRDVKYGGIIVRNENGKVLIENDPRINSGTMIIQQGDDVQVIFRDEDKVKPNEVIEALQPLLKK